MDKILYMTTFSLDLYEATGREMLESYFRLTIPEPMLICYEGTECREAVMRDFGEEVMTHKVFLWDITESMFLRTWLAANRDVIPAELGGNWKGCDCPDPDNSRAKNHKQNCIGDWWRKNASRWFRLIVMYDYAAQIHYTPMLVRIDSDTVFKQRIDPDWLEEQFDGNGVLYFQGERSHPEVGLILFHLENGGREFIHHLADLYASGRWRDVTRWDDCEQTRRVLKLHPEIKTKDIAGKMYGHSEVVGTSVMGEYLDHRKGTHGRVLKVMK